MSEHDTYNKLIQFLDENNASYRLIDHEPEGRTEIVSPMRGHAASEAAKCMILMVKITKKVKKYVLAVVPGDARVDMEKVKKLYCGIYLSFAAPEAAEKLSGCVQGTILPFTFNDEMDTIIDPSLKEKKELFFNAARLDRSMALKTDDYLRLVENPRFETIALAPEPLAQNG